MSKKYTCNLCPSGTTKSNYETMGCCATCRDKVEKHKKSGTAKCIICSKNSTAKFIELNGLCLKCSQLKATRVLPKTADDTKTASELNANEEGIPETIVPETVVVAPETTETKTSPTTNASGEAVDHTKLQLIEVYEIARKEAAKYTDKLFLETLQSRINEWIQNQIENTVT
jgi:hypothetical protein